MLITSQLPEAPLRKLAQFASQKRIPLFAMRTYGLIGLLRLQLDEYTSALRCAACSARLADSLTHSPVTESHPDNDRFDLYLHPKQLAAFPELKKFCDSFNAVLDMDKAAATKDQQGEHGHIPYAVVFLNMFAKFLKQVGAPFYWLIPAQLSAVSRADQQEDRGLHCTDVRRGPQLQEVPAGASALLLHSHRCVF